MKVRIEVSARHVHLTQHDLEILFGEGYKLKAEKDLSQGGEFSSFDTLTLVGPKRKIEGVRVLGPCRNITQVELSKSDAVYLGVNAPIRLSGKVIGSGPIKLIGPKAELDLEQGAIVAKRHLHCSPTQASKLALKNGENVKIKIDGQRALVFGEVEVRLADNFDLSVHLDTDEGNSAGLGREGGEGEII